MVSSITTLESEFLANIMLPYGGTVRQWLAPQIDEDYVTGSGDGDRPLDLVNIISENHPVQSVTDSSSRTE